MSVEDGLPAADGDRATMTLKGTALASTLNAIQKLHGPAGLAAVRAALPVAVRRLLDAEPILAVRWYPVEILAALHLAVRDVIAHGDWTGSHALGMAAAREDFGNLYRIVIRALNATTVWNRMERMWTLYNSRGKFTWLERKAGSVHVLIRDVAGYNPGMWNAVAGRGQQVILMTGAKAANVSLVRSTETEGEFEGLWFE